MSIDIPDYFPERPWACRCGCGLDNVSPELVRRVNMARHLSGVPFAIMSCCRCRERNIAVGGAENSAHLRGEAVDIRTTNARHRYHVIAGAIGAGFRRIGISNAFVHLDISEKNLASPVIWLYT